MYNTSPHPIVNAPLQAQVPYVNSAEQVVDRLSEAAQRIAEEEQTESMLHKRPHASRLSPIRDISADIRRESTPLSSVPKTTNPLPSTDLPRAPQDHIIDDNTPLLGHFPGLVNTPGIQESGQGEQGQDLSKRMPDLWPWLLEADSEDTDTDNWANRTDPLTLRHFPSSEEAARIEEEDIRRAQAENASTVHFTTRLAKQRARSSRLRIIFIILTVLAVLALLIDGILLTAALLHSHRTPNNQNSPASLTISPNAASIGQHVTAHISHFTPSTSVLLTHDIEEPVQTATGSALLKLDAHGNASVSILVDTSWGPGFHTLEAEDVTTRYTASAILQVLNAGQTLPSHLKLDTTLLNMGADLEGANTIKMLTLHNAGDGAPISWAASSNASWLLLSPTQGIFSTSQTLSVAVERANVKPGKYQGKITLSSNVDRPQAIQVTMSVLPLPAHPGPVLSVMPAVLSFMATDGGANPVAQVLTLSDPGTGKVSWSLASSTQAPVASQNSLFHALGVKANWLSTNVTSGSIQPGASQQVQVNVISRTLLPGTYTSTLVFTPNAGPYSKPQSVAVSLTVQPHCGLLTSTGNLPFTAVAGQSNPSNQPLGLSVTTSCTTPLNWRASSSASWLSVTPSSGQLKGAATAVTSVAVNTSGLAPGNYSGVLAFLTGQSTQSVTVQLTVQAQPSGAAPIIAVSSLTLNFNNTQGLSSPASQVVTITNTGSGALTWSTSVNQLAPYWLSVSPSGGTIPAGGQTGQMSVNVNTNGLTPGTYVGQIVLSGRDSKNAPAGGSPQTITVNLLVLAPCTLVQPSPSSLVFNAAQGGGNPGPQTVQITATGNCGWPLSWHANVSANWLNVSPGSGSISVSGQSVSIVVAANITGMMAEQAPYTAQVTISATDSAGVQAQGSPQMFSVSLNIMPPCTLSASPTSLAFTAPDASTQPVTLSETGNCARPVSWSANAGSSSWLVLSPSSGSDSGIGSTLAVGVNPTNLAPGTYTGQITISATNAGGSAVQASPQTITVTLIVPGFSVSGTVLACSDNLCTTSAPLPGAALTVLNGLNTQVASATADNSGNYSLSPLAPGTYTVNVSGTDSTGKQYTGNVQLIVTTDQIGFVIKVF